MIQYVAWTCVGRPVCWPCRTHRVLCHIHVSRVPFRIFPDLLAFTGSQANPLRVNRRLTAENINTRLEDR
jgi:hypothetical protein